MTAAESDAEQQHASAHFQDLVPPIDAPQTSHAPNADDAEDTQEAILAGRPGTAKDPRPQWEIQTESEKYVDTLEKQLKRVKIKGPADGQNNECKSNGRTPQPLQLSTSDSEEDDMDSVEDRHASETEDQQEVTETTCLLYDAHQQDKDRKRLLEDETARYGVNTYVQEAAHTEDFSHDSDQIGTTNTGSNSRRSSLHITSVPHQALVLSQEAYATPAPSPSRIQFCDSVRISGGVKTSRNSRVQDVMTVSHPVPSANIFYTHSPSANSRFATPRGSFSHSRSASGRVSRATSFLSEDGTGTGRSRASTPASIYAPLLIPSKSAPSPSRHFYLTFKRADGQATYRELVRRQSERRKKRRRGRTRSKLGSDDECASDEDEEDSDDYSTHCGNGWFCGITFWTCGIIQVFGSWKRRQRRAQRPAEEDLSDAESQTDTAATDESQSGILSASDSGHSGHTSRQQNKSEMQVLFGNRPWRFFRLGYWSYRTRGIRGVQQLLDQEDEERW